MGSRKDASNTTINVLAAGKTRPVIASHCTINITENVGAEEGTLGEQKYYNSKRFSKWRTGRHVLLHETYLQFL